MIENCEYCGGELGEFVHLQSFFYKCLNCKQNGAATSFDAIKFHLEGEYEVYLTDEELKKKTFLGKKNIENLFSKIENEAAFGKLIYLKKTD